MLHLFSAMLSSGIPPTVANWRSVYDMYLVLSVSGAIVAYGLILFYVLKGRRRAPKPPTPNLGEKGNLLALVVMASIVVAAFIAGVEGNSFVWDAPTNIPTLTVKVYAYQWGWNFTYPDGYTTTNNLVVPVNTTIILNVTSKDVFHSLGIPMFDVKADAIPGQWTALWFMATQTGSYPYAIRCYELCGVGHAYMTANLTVLSQPAFQQWYSSHGAGKP